jgi:acetolactate synthase regulatory subunit
VTAIAVDPAPVRGHSYARRRRLSLTTTTDRDVLLRVLTLLRRRGFDVVCVDYQAADLHRPAVLSLTVESAARTAHRVEAWLTNIVGVVSVDELR